jgi:hypothetical protein
MNYLSAGKNWKFTLACTVLLISGVTALRAQDPDALRPAAVPAEYVATPMGYFHPSCVLALAEGDTVRKDEHAIEHRDGSFDAIPFCSLPHYTHNGEKVPLESEGPAGGEKADSAGSEAPSIVHEYIELATMKTGSTYKYFGELRANWTVPAAPTSHDGQTIYLFPGLEDDNANPPIPTTILQPVLGWNAKLQYSVPNVWSIASWNCCVDNTVQHSPGIATAAGHEIYGGMILGCAVGAPRCGSFTVSTADENTGKESELKQTSSFGLVFNWAFAGALEVYDISKCSDYPSGSKGSTQFYYLGLLDQDLNPVTQDWAPWEKWKSEDVTPVCNYGVSTGEKGGLHDVTLTY